MNRPLVFADDQHPRKKKAAEALGCTSQEMIGNSSQDRLLLNDDEPAFVWSSLVLHFGLPAVPDWAHWFLSELQSRKKIQPMMGFGYTGIAVKVNRKELLNILESGLRRKKLVLPDSNGPVLWSNKWSGSAGALSSNPLPLQE